MNLQSEFFYGQDAVFLCKLSLIKIGTFSANIKIAYKACN